MTTDYVIFYNYSLHQSNKDEHLGDFPIGLYLNPITPSVSELRESLGGGHIVPTTKNPRKWRV